MHRPLPTLRCPRETASGKRWKILRRHLTRYIYFKHSRLNLSGLDFDTLTLFFFRFIALAIRSTSVFSSTFPWPFKQFYQKLFLKKEQLFTFFKKKKKEKGSEHHINKKHFRREKSRLIRFSLPDNTVAHWSADFGLGSSLPHFM